MCRRFRSGSALVNTGVTGRGGRGSVVSPCRRAICARSALSSSHSAAIKRQ